MNAARTIPVDEPPELRLRWARRVLRAAGALNLLYAAAGGWMMAARLRSFPALVPATTPEPPYWREVWYALAALNVVYLVALGVTGLMLLAPARLPDVAEARRGQRLPLRAVTVCNYLFLIELAHYVGLTFAYDASDALPRSAILRSIAVAVRVADDGLLPQMITGWPLVALVALNLARRRLLNAARQEVIPK